jgi:hypothetical protein
MVLLAVAHALSAGGTDSKQYERLVSAEGSVLRFDAVPMAQEDLGRVHGTDERQSVHAFRCLLPITRRVVEQFVGQAHPAAWSAGDAAAAAAQSSGGGARAGGEQPSPRIRQAS